MNDIFDTINMIHTFGIWPEKRQIWLTCEDSYAPSLGDGVEPGVEYVMASRFIKNLEYLVDTMTWGEIDIFMKTGGGYWDEGIAIYDALHRCPLQTRMMVLNTAHSMSSIILQGADKRLMAPNSTFMYHEGSFGVEGTTKASHSASLENQRQNDVMMDIYARRMRNSQHGTFYMQDEKKIKKFLKRQMDAHEDVYLTAKEAIELGLADDYYK